MQLSGARRTLATVAWRYCSAPVAALRVVLAGRKRGPTSRSLGFPQRPPAFQRFKFLFSAILPNLTPPPGLFALPLERRFAPRASSGRFAEEPRERARTESISGKTKSKHSTPLRLSPVPGLRGRVVAIGSGKPLSLQSPAPSAIQEQAQAQDRHK